MTTAKGYPVLTLRPYQALCIVCSVGEDDAGSMDDTLKKAFDAIRSNPDMPVSLCCNAGDVYAYQDPGTEADTPEGSEYNRKRDLDILQQLDLAPGSVLPARILFRRLLKTISTVSGICAYDTTTSDAWKGCPKAKSGYYERGREKGIEAIVPPRDEAAMARDKEESLAAMYQAAAIKIRPHILLCAVAQYGGGTRPPFKPDNLPEFIQHILKNPDTPVTLAKGPDWMMCAPCPGRIPELDGCVCGIIGSGGLYNELKDLNVLQQLGLTYGATMPAGELYTRIFDRFPTVAGVCALEHDLPDFAVWHDPCGTKSPPCPNYAKGRQMLIRELG